MALRTSGLLASLAAATASALAACVQPTPVTLRAAPTPTPDEVAQIRSAQTRSIQVPIESVFPKVLNVLMDNGYIIRSVDSRTGFVAFYQRWTDSAQHNAIISMEGSAVFTSTGPNTTQIRVALTGGSQLFQVTELGTPKSGPGYGMAGGAQQSADAYEIVRVLDLLQKGLQQPA